MKENFDKAFDMVIGFEGDLSNDSDDPGGLTRWGISQRSYPNLDIRALTLTEAMKIYKKDYWNACDCDELEYPWDIIVFDTAVNCGVERAIHIFHKVHIWQDYLLMRIDYYADLAGTKNYAKYLRGWINRTILLWEKFR